MALNLEEATEVGAIREAKEETGFDVEMIAWLAEFTDAYSFRSYYLAKRVGGEPATRDEDGDRPVAFGLSFQEALARVTSPFDRAALEMVIKALDEEGLPRHTAAPVAGERYRGRLL